MIMMMNFPKYRWRGRFCVIIKFDWHLLWKAEDEIGDEFWIFDQRRRSWRDEFWWKHRTRIHSYIGLQLLRILHWFRKQGSLSAPVNEVASNITFQPDPRILSIKMSLCVCVCVRVTKYYIVQTGVIMNCPCNQPIHVYMYRPTDQMHYSLYTTHVFFSLSANLVQFWKNQTLLGETSAEGNFPP